MMNRLILLFFILLLNKGLVYAQDLKWDSLSRPASYDLRKGYFKQYKTSKNDIIFLGNSITAGIDWSELFDNPNMKNRGISGDYTYGILERIGEITSGKPAKIFLLIGINDIAKNIPDEVIIKNITRIVRTLKTETPTTQIYLQTLLPVNNTFTQFTKSHFNKDEHIQAVNRGIISIAKDQKVGLIDLHPKFLDAKDRLNLLYTYDGLHLNGKGYALWKTILEEYIDKK